MTTISRSSQEARAENLEIAPWRQLAGGALVLIVATLGILAPRLFSQATLASFIEKGACAELGAECRVSGPIHAHLLPLPAIDAQEVTLSLPDGRVAIRAAHATAELRALPLIAGRISVNHLDLEGARIDLLAPAGGMRLLTSANDAGAALLESIAAADRAGNRLTRVGIDRSRLVIRSAGAKAPMDVESFSAEIDLPSRGGEFFGHLKGAIGGEIAELHVSGPSLAEVTRSEGSAVKVDALLGQNWLSYRGRLVKAPDLVAAGTLEASFPSLQHLFGPLRRFTWPPWLSDMDFHLAGQVFVTSRGVDFENSEFAVGRSHFAGGLSLRTTSDGRPSLSGTIATPLVEFADFSWLRPAEIALPAFDRLPDLDLRMSVRRVRFGSARLDEIAAGLILAKGRLDVTLSQGLETETGAKVHIVATPDAGEVAVKAQASCESLDVGTLLSSFSAHPVLTGTGGFNLSLEGRGGTLDALAHALSGKANLQVKKGVVSLPDADAEPLASVVSEKPLVASLAPALRRFSEANFAGAVENGIWKINEGWIGEGVSQIAVDGTVDVADRHLDLSFSGPGDAHADPPWRLRAAGPWSEPSVWRQPPAAR
ncbi:MAG: AsmA family protein [Hyphomicrobiales bacterium]|nr:AsmA family protein [Hyphomicrobiales bacterium]